MSPTLTIVTKPLDLAALDRIDYASEAIVLTTAALRSFDGRMNERLADRRTLAIGVADGATLGGFALAGALACDWLALGAAVRLDLDSAGDAAQTGEHAARSAILAGVLWRIPATALRLHVTGARTLTADAALSLHLADALVPHRADPVQWAIDWIGDRSLIALHAAAMLIRRRGGDRLERAEFARLFAAGEPQRGLEQFLTRRRPELSDGWRTEIV